MSFSLRKQPTARERAAQRSRELADATAARVRPAASAVRTSAAQQAVLARDYTVPRLEHANKAAREWAGPRAESAAVWAAPRVDSAREWAAPRLEAVVSAREDLLPKVAAAVATALAAAEPVRDEARVRSTAAVQALRGDVRPVRSRGRVRRSSRGLAVVGAAGAVAAAAAAGYKAWSDSRSDPWGDVPGYTPPSGPAVEPVAPPVPAVPLSDDPAAASPDEALADAVVEEPGAAGTPREKVVDLTEPGEETRAMDPLEPPLAQGTDQRPPTT